MAWFGFLYIAVYAGQERLFVALFVISFLDVLAFGF